VYGLASFTTGDVTMAQPRPRDLFPGALEMMVLRLVQHEPLHGYALVQRISQVSNDMLQVEEGSLYPALQRLLKGKLLQAEWGVSATNRRVRLYRVTPAGRKHLAAQVSSFEQMLAGISLVLGLRGTR
jgi:PadR family transcriptional regulator PadR